MADKMRVHVNGVRSEPELGSHHAELLVGFVLGLPQLDGENCVMLTLENSNGMDIEIRIAQPDVEELIKKLQEQLQAFERNQERMLAPNLPSLDELP